MLDDAKKNEVIHEVMDLLEEYKGKRYSEIAEALAAKYTGLELFFAGFIAGTHSIFNQMARQGIDTSGVIKKLTEGNSGWL